MSSYGYRDTLYTLTASIGELFSSLTSLMSHDIILMHILDTLTIIKRFLGVKCKC